MILGMEIGLLILGLVALFRGKMTLSKTKVVEGGAARVLGLLAVTPLPLAFVVGFGFIAVANPADPEKFAADNRWTIIGIEAAIVIIVAILVFSIGAAVGTDPAEAAPRRKKRPRRRDEEDDRGEDDRVRRRNRYEDEDDADDEDDDYGEPRRRRGDGGGIPPWQWAAAAGVCVALVVAVAGVWYVARQRSQERERRNEEVANAAKPAPAVPPRAPLEVPPVVPPPAPVEAPPPAAPPAAPTRPAAPPLISKTGPAGWDAPTISRDRLLGSRFGTEFRDAAPDGGVLVGFEVGLARFATFNVVGTVRPVYRVAGADAPGRRFGTDDQVGTVSVVAKPGYAVGAVTVTSAIWVEGFSITFMRVAGDRLDPTDAYESEWVGNVRGNRKPARQTGGGTAAVGVVGRENKERVSALGLVFRPDRK